MKFSSIYFLLSAIVLLAISSFSYYLIDKNDSSDEILFIESNLDNYRTIPEDKGGLDDPCLNLEICNMGNE